MRITKETSKNEVPLFEANKINRPSSCAGQKMFDGCPPRCDGEMLRGGWLGGKSKRTALVESFCR